MINLLEQNLMAIERRYQIARSSQFARDASMEKEALILQGCKFTPISRPWQHLVHRSHARYRAALYRAQEQATASLGADLLEPSG